MHARLFDLSDLPRFAGGRVDVGRRVLRLPRRLPEELAVKQADFQRRIAGTSRWDYDMEDGSLTLGNMRFGMTPIGTFSAEFQSWLWAWANEDFPEAARADSRRVQGLHAVTGFRVFLELGAAASSSDAQDFTALAVHHLGAIGFFRCPSDGPVLFLAVHEPESQEAEPGVRARPDSH